MNMPTPQQNDRLLHDAMSTPSLESFFDNVEQQFVTQLENSAPISVTNSQHKWWIGLGGGAALLIVTSAIIWYVQSPPDTPVVRPAASPISEMPASTTKTDVPVPTPAPPVEQKPTIMSGSTSEAKVTAQAQPTRTLSAQTRRDIDSLDLALKSTTTPADAARIGYQLGLRYRLAGDNAKAIDLLLASSATAHDAGANVLSARGLQQAAKAALQLGDRPRATSLYNQALQTLPATESALHNQWRSELDSLLR